MKIVFVCDTMGSGGAERVISTLSNEFVLNNHEVSIVMIGRDSTESFYVLNNNIRLIRLLENQKRKVGVLKKANLLKKCILDINPDVVISFLSYVCIYTWWALKNTKIPYIVSERNDPNQRGFIKQLLLNQSFKKAAGCVFQTEDALSFYKKICKDKSTIIYNPVNLTFKPKKIDERKKQILYVGRLIEQKNCEMLIYAFGLFIKNHPEYTLKMYGDGPLKEKLLSQVNDLNLNDKVTILPSNKSWQSLEYDSSMFVLASKYEGMPNVLAEALSLGIPSVSTNCAIGGPKELKKLFNKTLVLSKEITKESLLEAMEEALTIKSNSLFIPVELKADYIANKWLKFIEGVIKK